MKKIILGIAIAGFCFLSICFSDTTETIRIEITDKVLVKDTIRMGINLTGDSYYNGALLKKRVETNFEGLTYRQIHTGTLFADGFATYQHISKNWEDRGWGTIYKKAESTIVSGPLKGTRVTIKDFSLRKVKPWNSPARDMLFFVFEKELTLPEGTEFVHHMGFRMDCFALNEGYLGDRKGDFWRSQNLELVHDDLPPGTTGKSALLMDATRSATQDFQNEAYIRFPTVFERLSRTNGKWHIMFKARDPRGNSKAEILTEIKHSATKQATLIPLVDTWKPYHLIIDVDDVPEPEPLTEPHLSFVFRVSRGAMLLDDVEIWMEGDTNPTVFNDSVIELLKEYKPGVLRQLQMGGNTVWGTIAPRILGHKYKSNSWEKIGPYERHAWGQKSFGMHEFYTLCEFLGCEPWFCLPGVLTEKEMREFMEYIGGPVDSHWGKRRAELGHPQPWTEVFTNIHIEFGNEAWNGISPYLSNGYNGADYWKDLIAAAKTSPHYRTNILFHAAGQNFLFLHGQKDS